MLDRIHQKKIIADDFHHQLSFLNHFSDANNANVVIRYAEGSMETIGIRVTFILRTSPGFDLPKEGASRPISPVLTFPVGILTTGVWMGAGRFGA
jgi:hypothetical protein